MFILLSGLQSGSWRLALTHFSQRYKRCADILVPESYKDKEEEYKYASENCIICFDHLQMHLSECEYLPAVSRMAMELLPTEK